MVSFFLHMRSMVVVFSLVGDGGGVVGDYTGIYISNPSV